MRTDILGVGFDGITVAQAVSHTFDLFETGEKAYIVTPNPEIVWQCRRDLRLRDAVNGAGIVLPDGVGIILAARILGTPISTGRAPGIDFASSIFERMAGSGRSVFLLGSKPGVAEDASKKLIDKYPGLIVSGTSDGYFTDDSAIIKQVNDARPDLLLVCLGSPKQELWMTQNIGRLDVRLCAGLGGSLDVFAGRVKRAPAFFRKLGLEWFYRLVCEPRRIKRMIKLPVFILAVIFKRMNGPVPAQLSFRARIRKRKM